MRVGWIGLGAMGAPMAARLAGAGYETVVWNRTPSVAADHAERHRTHAVDLEQVARADVVFSCLPTTTEVIRIIDRVTDASGPEAVWVDCTSGDPRDVPAIAGRLEARAFAYLDAPVSGMARGAEAGELTVMVGGPRPMFEKAEPLMRTFGSRVFLLGPNGTGYLMKALNNMLFALNFWASAEALACLSDHGVDPALALDVLNAGSGGSNVTRRFIGSEVLSADPTPAFRLGQLVKDVDVAAAMLSERPVPSLLLEHTRDLYHRLLDIAGTEVDAVGAFSAVQQARS